MKVLTKQSIMTFIILALFEICLVKVFLDIALSEYLLIFPIVLEGTIGAQIITAVLTLLTITTILFGALIASGKLRGHTPSFNISVFRVLSVPFFYMFALASLVNGFLLIILTREMGWGIGLMISGILATILYLLLAMLPSLVEELNPTNTEIEYDNDDNQLP